MDAAGEPVGYLFVALAMALFFMAFVLGFNSTMATLVIIAFIIGCVLLAPSIIVGYAVKAAEREDRETVSDPDAVIPVTIQ